LKSGNNLNTQLPTAIGIPRGGGGPNSTQLLIGSMMLGLPNILPFSLYSILNKFVTVITKAGLLLMVDWHKIIIAQPINKTQNGATQF
jgi:hypothetical protein